MSGGSSPRMRGALYQVGEARKDVGIIPAYAGSTRPAASRTESHQDHPGVCGEHNFQPFTAISRRGSSPRMRGARNLRVQKVRR